MLWKYLDKLRALPEDSRRSVAVFLAVCLGLFIWVPWFFLHDNGDSEKVADTKSVGELLSPFSFVKEGITSATGRVKKDWNQIAGVMNIIVSGGQGATTTVVAVEATTTSPAGIVETDIATTTATTTTAVTPEKSILNFSN